MQRFRFLFLGLLLSILSSTSALAQGDISGRLVDENKAALPSATVMLTSAEDSVLVGFSMSDAAGRFVLKNVPQGEFILQVTFLGYDELKRNLSIRQKKDDQDLGDLQMQEKSTTLDDVEISTEMIPVRVKGDTVEYAADAFKTQPNAAVEDLLKRLPGVEVDQDGNIKAQGESVTKILVDGKEFFGDDPKVASKNLPAKAIDKVQVFDKMSEIADFTGIDDGTRNRTINLALKEDYKTGYFGNVSGGYGTKERFAAKANLNRFSEASQLSFLGMANNTNEQAFSIQDYISFMGGLSRILNSGNMGGGPRIRLNSGNFGLSPNTSGLNGINTSGAAGINFNQDFGTKTELQSSYFYNYLQNDLRQNTFRENILEQRTFTTQDTTTSQDRNHNHRVNLRVKHRIDSLSELLLTGTGRYNLTEGASDNEVSSFAGAEAQNTTFRQQNTTGNLVNVDSRLQYRRKFRKRGRALVLEGSLAHQNNQSDIDLLAVNGVRRDTFGFFVDTLNQAQPYQQTHWDLGGKVTYTEPIGKRKYLEFNYAHQENFNNLDKSFFNRLENGGSSLDSSLSNRYEGGYRYDVAGSNFRLVKKKSNLVVGLSLQRSALEGVIGFQDTTIRKTFLNLLPALRWNYSPGKGKRIRLNYTASVNAPSIEELQPVVDNSNPFNLTAGNPDLGAETAHNLRLNYSLFDMFTFTSFFASLNATYTSNKIGQSTTVDSLFRQLTIPVNVDQDFSLRAMAYFNTPIRKLGIKFGVSPNISYNRAITLINGVENPTDRLTSSGEFKVENRKKNWLDAVAGVRLTHNITQYAIDADMNQSYLNTTYFGDVTVTFLKNLNINTTFDYTIYAGGGFAESIAVPLWRANISKSFLGNERLEVKASVFDILNQNRGISRTTQLNFLEETRANALGRYYMLTLTYKILAVGKRN